MESIPATREAKDCKFEASLDNLVRLSQIQNRTRVVAQWWSVCLTAHSLRFPPQDCRSRSAVTPLSSAGTDPTHTHTTPSPRRPVWLHDNVVSVLSEPPSEGEPDIYGDLDNLTCPVSSKAGFDPILLSKSASFIGYRLTEVHH